MLAAARGRVAYREEIMTSAPRIEEATEADIAALSELRHMMDWSRGIDLLTAIQGWEGGRIFIIRAGELASLTGEAARLPGAATVAIATPPVGVIGNVVVRPEYQRGGMGRMLMEHALDWLRSQGARQVSLDASAAGRSLYRRLGFTDVASSWYTRAPLASLEHAELRRRAEDADVADIVWGGVNSVARIAKLDRAAFGGARFGLLRQLMSQPNHGILIGEDAGGAPLGYLMTRPPEPPLTGARIGPLVARSSAVAAALLSHVIERADATGALIASIAGANPCALALFHAIGATPVEDDIIMRLDLTGAPNDPPAPADDDTTHAQAYCWLSPMVF
jgi:GNAT superfamily N-acetyltransferase